MIESHTKLTDAEIDDLLNQLPAEITGPEIIGDEIAANAEWIARSSTAADAFQEPAKRKKIATLASIENNTNS